MSIRLSLGKPNAWLALRTVRCNKRKLPHRPKLWPIDGITVRQHNGAAGDQDVWHFRTHIKGRIKNDNLQVAKNLVIPAEE